MCAGSDIARDTGVVMSSTSRTDAVVIPADDSAAQERNEPRPTLSVGAVAGIITVAVILALGTLIILVAFVGCSRAQRRPRGTSRQQQ
ncbi:MAG: hypothetical protein EOO65_01470 [Methanosarcinales archaeon]|nr:MAG: hypothetical protein EOO65_01470 [Methanosarcinales archaeon]